MPPNFLFWGNRWTITSKAINSEQALILLTSERVSKRFIPIIMTSDPEIMLYHLIDPTQKVIILITTGIFSKPIFTTPQLLMHMALDFLIVSRTNQFSNRSSAEFIGFWHSKQPCIKMLWINRSKRQRLVYHEYKILYSLGNINLNQTLRNYLSTHGFFVESIREILLRLFLMFQSTFFHIKSVSIARYYFHILSTQILLSFWTAGIIVIVTWRKGKYFRIWTWMQCNSSVGW